MGLRSALRKLALPMMLAVLLSCALESSARARGLADEPGPTITLFTAPTVALVGLATVIGNTYTLAHGQRRGNGLPIAGLVVAGLELAIAGICLHYSTEDVDDEAPGLFRNIAIASAAWGLVNGALALWAWTRPLARSKISLAPLPMVASDGSLALGLALRVARF